MWVFRSTIDIDRRGQSWSPQIKMFCPYCTAGITFYSYLVNNRCKCCNKLMPFDTRMAKDQQKRVEYHVESNTDEEGHNILNVGLL